ncbi:hypothetical protein P4H71_06865 [Paenibacillus kribbensis]|uniref:hypothetical protein n=1 Tax=Paenibacillus kribbensis TaxID=172713 RepID=UPI002DB9D735|nr:hypothetical protein [Paenibacillus kribbensis]MEC0234051.1 hypothetical protein [Paenibacillus kribbensis]
MNRGRYMQRHWKYYFRPGLSLKTVSRKTKKAINNEFKLMALEIENRNFGVDFGVDYGTVFDPFLFLVGEEEQS